MYMQDHPRSSPEEAEMETEEYGYIRNIDSRLRWFMTTPDTEYYMPDAAMSVRPVKVRYDVFNKTMITAIDNNDAAITFVRVTVAGEDIVKVEWVYHP